MPDIKQLEEKCTTVGIKIDTSAETVNTAAKDASQLKSSPLAVVYPESAEDISSIVKICSELNIPVSIAGGYTGLSGGVLGSDAVRIETRQLDKFDIKNNTVRTQAGASVPEIIRAA
ncbi:MAG: FAD-binding oxidoreductase, partial [Planctomycetota bacterium]